MVASNAYQINMSAPAIRKRVLLTASFHSGAPSPHAADPAELGKLVATDRYSKTVCSEAPAAPAWLWCNLVMLVLVQSIAKSEVTVTGVHAPSPVVLVPLFGIATSFVTLLTMGKSAHLYQITESVTHSHVRYTVSFHHGAHGPTARRLAAAERKYKHVPDLPRLLMAALLALFLKEHSSVVLVHAQSIVMSLRGMDGPLVLGHVALGFRHGAGVSPPKQSMVGTPALPCNPLVRAILKTVQSIVCGLSMAHGNCARIRAALDPRAAQGASLVLQLLVANRVGS